MRQLRRIYQRPDGGITIVHPSWDDDICGFGRTAHQTEAEWYQWAVTNRIPPDYISHGDVDVASIPTDRSARRQWTFLNGIQVAPPTLADVQQARASAYPHMGDQLDALWKGGAEAEAMKALVMAVKAMYPKPSP